MIKTIISALTILCLTTMLSKLNAQIAHDLTIYSEDGYKFTLVVYGQEINEEPSSNVKMENINDDYIKVILKFEDKTIADIKKNILQIAGPEGGYPVSVVYKLIEKKGKFKLKWVSRSNKKIQPKGGNVIIIKEEKDTRSGINIRL